MTVPGMGVAAPGRVGVRRGGGVRDGPRVRVGIGAGDVLVACGAVVPGGAAVAAVVAAGEPVPAGGGDAVVCAAPVGEGAPVPAGGGVAVAPAGAVGAGPPVSTSRTGVCPPSRELTRNWGAESVGQPSSA
jgi:hypothetical protein